MNNNGIVATASLFDFILAIYIYSNCLAMYNSYYECVDEKVHPTQLSKIIYYFSDKIGHDIGCFMSKPISETIIDEVLE